MVNASLNWASIVGIVLAVGGAMLYFMRSFKPALARDYDVFFAAIGLLCGGILFFQGWRLDPILQFGQFLLAGTTVFFAYESVRLRGVATEQARRSAYFDDEPAPPRGPGAGGRGDWDDPYERFDEPQPLRRRFSSRDGEADFDSEPQEDFYRPRRNSRAAIPEQAASRRPRSRDDSPDDWGQEDERSRRMARFRAGEDRPERRADFGDRRSQRDDQRRGSRPSGRVSNDAPAKDSTARDSTAREPAKGFPSRPDAEEASYAPSRRADPNATSSRTSRPAAASSSRRVGPDSTPKQDSGRNRADASESTGNARPSGGGRPAPRSSRPRDNSSRFDD